MAAPSNGSSSQAAILTFGTTTFDFGDILTALPYLSDDGKSTAYIITFKSSAETTLKLSGEEAREFAEFQATYSKLIKDGLRLVSEQLKHFFGES